jgi:hypothetical protein
MGDTGLEPVFRAVCELFRPGRWSRYSRMKRTVAVIEPWSSASPVSGGVPQLPFVSRRGVLNSTLKAWKRLLNILWSGIGANGSSGGVGQPSVRSARSSLNADPGGGSPQRSSLNSDPGLIGPGLKLLPWILRPQA